MQSDFQGDKRGRIMRVVFGTVVYEAAYKFHKEFIETINNQDTMEFDVLLLNDNLELDKFDAIIKGIDRNVLTLESTQNSTIPETRIELMKWAKQHEYDLLILGDFDDTMSKNRISETILDFDAEYCFYYNELYYLNTGKKFFTTLPPSVESILPILECNFLGLSNTALNLNMVDMDILDILYNKQTVAFDWIIYSILLLRGYKGKRVDGCKTYYRIYDQNTAGETDMSIEGLKKEIEIKRDHYSKLFDIDSVYDDLQMVYNKLNDSFEEYAHVLLINARINNRYWWGKLDRNMILKEME
jgi:hypothetical protein